MPVPSLSIEENLFKDPAAYAATWSAAIVKSMEVSTGLVMKLMPLQCQGELIRKFTDISTELSSIFAEVQAIRSYTSTHDVEKLKHLAITRAEPHQQDFAKYSKIATGPPIQMHHNSIMALGLYRGIG